MTYVYILQHSRELPDRTEDVKLIGVYSSEIDASRAMSRLRRAPGFKEFPAGFSVDRYELDKDHWAEGFITD